MLSDAMICICGREAHRKGPDKLPCCDLCNAPCEACECPKIGRICRHCGKLEEDHCAYEPYTPAPGGCVCAPGEWENPDDIPKPCAEYAGPGRCETCEHDETCHRSNTPC